VLKGMKLVYLEQKNSYSKNKEEFDKGYNKDFLFENIFPRQRKKIEKDLNSSPKLI